MVDGNRVVGWPRAREVETGGEGESLRSYCDEIEETAVDSCEGIDSWRLREEEGEEGRLRGEGGGKGLTRTEHKGTELSDGVREREEEQGEITDVADETVVVVVIADDVTGAETGVEDGGGGFGIRIL